jgi:hypothetical protein
MEEEAMGRRYVVLGLSVAFALALAVPALGGPSNPIATSAASAKKLANKALKTANAANSAAQSAQSTANQALTAANSAQTSADSAKTAADAATAAANAAANQTIGASRIGREFTFGDSGAVSSTAQQSGAAVCTGDKVAVGGGGNVVRGTAVATDPIALTATVPFIYDSWIAAASEMSAVAGTWQVSVDEICINP